MTGDTEKGKLASATGFANEQRLLAALLSRGYNASHVDLPHSTYDIVVELPNDSSVEIIRVQVKTINKSGSIPFQGGMRGGKDREYKSGVKTYTHSTETADVIVGVECEKDNGDTNINYYIIPTLYIETLGQKSITKKKVPEGKNNWDLLFKCKDRDYISQTFGIHSPKQSPLSMPGGSTLA